MSARHLAPSKKRKRTRRKKLWVIILVVLAAVAIAAFFTVNHYLNLIQYDEPEESAVPTAEPISVQEESLLDIEDGDKSEEIMEYEEYLEENTVEVFDVDYEFDDDLFHILLVGLDTNETETLDRGRTDTMLVVTVNRAAKRIILTSLLRDTYVSIPGFGKEKLNAAYQIGGAELLFSTIESNYKIHLENYAAVNFYTFMDVIDAIGGVDIDITPEDIWSMNQIIGALSQMNGAAELDELLPPNTPGIKRLDGIQALAYARNRFIGDDRHRTERQRTVINAAINSAGELSLPELMQLAEVVLPGIRTNMEKTDILALLSHAPEYLSYEIVSLRLPTDQFMTFNTIHDMSVVCADFKSNYAVWAAAVNGQ